MYLDGLVVQTKLMPPRLIKRILPRLRLRARLLDALNHRLTIVQAGAGYGKSTALAGLAGCDAPVVWYHLEREDSDPLLFLLYLLYGFANAFDGLSEAPLAVLETQDRAGASLPWTAVTDLLINELARRLDRPTLLVLDDAHLLDSVPESLRILERLIRYAPANLHIILSTRYPLDLDELVAMRVRGDVLEIHEAELAFTQDEIQALFRDQYGIRLSTADVDALAATTEGWAISLQLIWQGLSHAQGALPDLAQALENLSGLKEDLFAFLAAEVLEKQPEDLRDFMRVTSVLRQMSPDVCDCLRGASDSARLMHRLVDAGLFVNQLDEVRVAYHNLFHEFLYHRLSPAEQASAHLVAARCFEQRGEGEEAVYHYLKAGAFRQAAALIVQAGRGMVLAGRLEMLSAWLSSLPPEALEQQPALLVYLGDIARLHSRFDEALGWYRQAHERCHLRGDIRGMAQALRGLARVYLDTVNPSQAEYYLREVLRLSDGQEDRETRANLLELMAENQLNLGHVEKAEELQAQARQLREQTADVAELSVRVMLRTGRLAEARQVLEGRVHAEKQEPVLRPRAHRETLLLLSIIQAFLGDGEAAYHNAVEGTRRGQELDSPFVTAVGLMRQGHAWLIREDADRYAQAVACYEQAIRIGEQIAVDRLKVEACWGLCRAYGYRGDLERAGQAASQAIEIAERAGDEWITAYIRLAMGAACALAARHDEAVVWLNHADASFRECSDRHGQAATRLWLCLVWSDRADGIRLEQGLNDLLGIVAAHGYDHLLTRATLAGPPDIRRVVPLLIAARARGEQRSLAGALLAQMGLEGIELHPGFRLRVQTLGAFRVWRGDEEVDTGEWQREKARQLFQLLITCRGTLLDRERICGTLWPDLSDESAQRSFKVALNALYQALEPGRERGAPSAFVVRSGSLYGLRPEADLWLDVSRLEQMVAEGDRAYRLDSQHSLPAYRQALDLYRGDFLAEFPYEDWADEERERLRSLYLRTADRVARVLVDARRWEEAAAVCEIILAADDCWENAYRLLMICHAQLGNRPQALRTYHQAVERLRQELDTEPSRETVELYQSIASAAFPPGV